MATQTLYSPFKDNSPSAEQWWADETDSDDNPGVDRDTTLVLVLDNGADPNCSCGCEQTKKNAKSGKAERGFIQGHDQAGKGKLIRAGRAGAEVTLATGGMLIHTDALGAAAHLGFTAKGLAQIAAGIEREGATPAPVVEWSDAPVTKVGRWEYPSRTNGTVTQRNSKRDGSGEWLTV